MDSWMKRSDKGIVCGIGGPDMDLSADQVRAIVTEALSVVRQHSTILAVIPDATRDDNTHILFPIVAEILEGKAVERLDVLVAQGTHPPMTPAQKLEKTGLKGLTDYRGLGAIYDHKWSDPDELVTLGIIP